MQKPLHRNGFSHRQRSPLLAIDRASAAENLTRRLSQYKGLGLASPIEQKMARISQVLNPGELKSLGEGEHCDGGGLYLRVTGMGGRSWIVKYQWAKKQEKMGIGSLADVGLAEARKKAKKIREQARDGINPKLHREQVSASARSAPCSRTSPP
jgi:Arm DNA-binding domain